MVATVVRLLQQAGMSPAIVSRGYRADASGTNDEKWVLDHLCPGVPHLQNPDRVVAAAEIVAQGGVDVIVLDDGFQHRRIARDCDIVLVDATNPFGHGYLLPRGLLRETRSGLCRADLVVITRCDQVSAEALASIESEIRSVSPSLSDRMLLTEFQPIQLLAAGGATESLESLNSQKAYLVTAIGNPSGFVTTCRRSLAGITGTDIFPDHHHYTTDDLRAVLERARQSSADVVLTTVKDLVKLRSLIADDTPEDPPILAVEIATVFGSTDSEDVLRSALENAVSRT